MFYEQVKRVFYILKESIAPKHCIGCDKRGTFLCNSCAARLYTPIHRCLFCKGHSGIGVCRKCSKKTYVDNIFWFTRYGNATTQALLHALKYRGAYEIAEDIARLLYPHIKQDPNLPVLIPIPLHKKRLRTRGFNQSAEIARHLSRHTGYFLDNNVLLRTVATPSFARHTTKEDRKRLIKNVFCSNGNVPENIILIDDVATSGSTLREAARILYKNGARNISAVVFAHD